MIFIYVVGEAQHTNNVALGKHVVTVPMCSPYSSVNAFGTRQE